jgi:YVTN family beta-propeller protein
VFHAPQKVFGLWGSEAFPVFSLRGFASLIELVTSPLIATGCFTSWAALAAAVEMVGAYAVVHLPRGGWPIDNRGELAVLYFVIFVYIAARGGGEYSLDRLRGTPVVTLTKPIAAAAAAMLVIGAGAVAGGSALNAARSGDSAADATALGMRIFVTNEESGDLSVIDGATASVVATAPLGKRPRGIKVSPDRKSLFVALSGSPNAAPGVDRSSLPAPDRTADGIGEVDVETLRVKRIIHAGIDPEQLDVSADGTRLYVANEDTAQLTVVDVPSGHIVQTIRVGDEPEGVAIRPDGKVVYVTSEADGQVFAIDTATNTLLTKITVGHRPRSIAFLPDSTRAYVTLENEGAITVIDAVRHRFVGLVPLEPPGAARKPRPMGIGVRPDGSSIYVTTGSFGSLFFFSPAANLPAGSLPVGERPWGVAISPDGRTAYTANGPSNDVSIVDLDRRELVKKLRVGKRPWGVAIKP